MSWLHQCKKPGDLKIWLKRKGVGAGWRCPVCGEVWILTRQVWRGPSGTFSFWNWQTRREDHEEGDEGNNTSQLGFQRNPDED